jgi:Spy/CpxP family protein refolding chaperone
MEENIMLGFLFGTACLIGLIKVARGSCHGYGCHGGEAWGHHGGGWGGHDSHAGRHGYGGGGARGGFGARFFLRSIFERLETTPGQEKVIVQAADELKGAFGKARGDLRATRADFARVFRGDAVDEASVADIFMTHDTVISETRRTAVEAVRKIHEALTDEQRKQVADFVEQGRRGRGGWGGGWGGPRRWM